MSYRESDIAYENGPAWVLRDTKGKCYTVFLAGVTHSTSDSAYPLDADGLSIAVARCNYLAAYKEKPRGLVGARGNLPSRGVSPMAAVTGSVYHLSRGVGVASQGNKFGPCIGNLFVGQIVVFAHQIYCD